MIGLTLICALPLAWLLLKITGNPAMAFVAQLIMMLVAQLLRLFFCRKLFKFSISSFVKEVFIPITKVGVCAVIPSYLAHCYFGVGILPSVAVMAVAVVSVIASVALLGLTRGERDFILTKLHLK